MIRNFNRQDEKMFPEAIQVALSGYRQNKLKPYNQVVEEFDQHVQSLANNGDIVSVYRMFSSFKRFLTTVIDGTNELDATKNLSNYVQRFREETGIQKTTMQNYLAKLKKFFSNIKLHASSRFPNYKNYPWEKILDEVRVHIRQGAEKQKKKKNRKLQKNVPTLDEVQRVNAMVVELLQRDLGQKVLEYKELSALIFLILSFSLYCRSGPILNLTWDDVQTIKQTGALETDQHKTGSFYDVTLKIEEDQHVWLKRMRRQFIEEFQTSPTFVFPTSNNTVDHSMSRTIRTVLGNLFQDLKDVDKESHSKAVKKMWDTHFYRNKYSLEHMFAAHLEQTGHTELTALKVHVVPVDKIQTLQIYLNQWSILDKQGTSVLQIPSSEKTPTCAQTLSHGKTPSGDKAYWKEKTPLQSETPSQGKTPLRNKPKVNCTPGSTSDRSTSDSTPAPPKRLRWRRETQNRRTMCDVMSNELFSDNEEANGGSKAGPDFTPSDDETSNEESMETKIFVNPTMLERYIHSLKSYWKYQPSVEVVEATALFYH